MRRVGAPHSPGHPRCGEGTTAAACRSCSQHPKLGYPWPPRFGVCGPLMARAWSALWRTLSTRHSFGFIGICLLLAAGGAGAGARVRPCLWGLFSEGGALGGPGGCWDGWDAASGSGMGVRVVLSQLPAPVMVPQCQPCPTTSAAAVLAARAIYQPGGHHPAPAHPSRCSEAGALYISCDGFQILLRFCSHGRVADTRSSSSICPQEPWGWTRSHTTGSQRGGTVLSMHGDPKGWAGEPLRDNWGWGPMVSWGDEAGMTAAAPGGDGDGDDGAVRAGSVETVVPPVPRPAL